MKLFQTILLIFFSGVLFSQNSKVTINITYNLYATDFDDNESLYKTHRIDIKKSEKINALIAELKNQKSINQLFAETKIDTTTVIENPKTLIKYYDDKYIGWNSQQINYISEKLNNINNFKEYFSDYLELGCCVGMHQRYRDEYVIKIYENNNLIDTFTSRKSLPNSKKIPWKSSSNNLNYNISVDENFFDVIGSPKSISLMTGNKLMKFLVSKIIDSHKNKLYELSGYDYFDKLNELKTDFYVLNIGEIYGSGRYIWNESKTYYARLKNDLMLPRINIMFLATKEGKTIYSRDYIKSDYKNIINRVQGINFLTNYLKENPSTNLDIYYFNNKPINDYNIDSFNKNPTEWKKQDDYIESLKLNEKNNIKHTFDINEAIKTSERNHCGCNYRLDRSLAEKAIFIELNNKETKENSVWYLLPDNKVLLYIMQGEKVLGFDYTKFGKSKGIQYPCILFDLQGNIIDRK